MTTYVLYHASCADGFGAAFAAWLKFGKDAEYIPVQYGKPFPDIVTGEGTQVFILDFSYPTKEIERLITRHDSVVVLDHHATAKTELEFLSEEYNKPPYLIRFDMEKSGAVLAWEYFHPDLGVPKFFLYLQDRDLWQWKLPGSREVSDAIRSYPFDFKVWKDLAGFGDSTDGQSPMDNLFTEGVALRRLTKKTVDIAAKNHRWAIFQHSGEICFADNVDGLGPDYSIYWGAPVLNCTAFISETCERMLEINPTAKFVASYFDAKDGKRIWSLRSRKEFDCSPIAKKFGGGGHAQACGFTQTI
jgi:uncharacterized protein